MTTSELIGRLPHYIMLVLMLEHIWFAIAEIFMWERAFGKDLLPKATPETIATVAPLAKTLGFYNAIIAAGLMWATAAENAFGAKPFFLISIVVVGIAGGRFISKKLYFIQALPALIALAFNWIQG